jgi:hypothetical protein
MAADSATLIVHCQIALDLTQRELGDLLGKNRRTIQRWQSRGCHLLPAEAKTLAAALRPVRPDLADQALALGQKSAIALGMTPPATLQEIDEILQAAARAAGGIATGAVRRAVTAAFVKAAERGFDLKAVVAGLRAKG